MNRLRPFTLIAVALLTFIAASASRADVVYSQLPGATGGVMRPSQLWVDPSGQNDLDSDAIAWENFTLTQAAPITDVEFWGDAAPGLGFRIRFYRQDPGTIAMQPDIIHPEGLLFEESHTDFVQTNAGNGTYNFKIHLSTPVFFQANTRYFVAIIGNQPIAYAPWNWAQGYGGDGGGTFYWVRGWHMYTRLGDDRAFTLSSNSAPPVLTSLTLAPTSIAGGQTSKGTVTLDRMAPAEGAVLALSSSNGAAASVLQSVTVPAGATSAAFSVTALSVAAKTTSVIAATYRNVTFSKTLTVNPPTLLSLSATPASVFGSASSTGKVTLTAAPLVDTTVYLTSGSTAVHVPASAVVIAGTTTVAFPISTDAVAWSTKCAILAVLGTAKKTATLTVKAPALASLTLTTSTVTGGNTVTGLVKLTSPAAVDTVIQLTNANLAAALPNGTNADTVTVPAGSTSVSFTLTTLPTPVVVKGAIKAALGTVSKSVTLSVTP